MELNYRTYGEGPPLLILHGLFGTLDNWQTTAKQLGAHHTVFAVDLRNHGRSPRAESHTYAELADDVRLFMETHWMFEGADVLGHSMGGKVAMQLALDHPALVERLVVVDIGPKAYMGGHDRIFDALLSLDLDVLENRQQAEAHIRRFESEEGVVQFLMKNLTRDPESGAFTWKMNLPVLYSDYPHILAEVQGDHPHYDGPTLFIRGGNSRYIQDKDLPAIAEKFPNYRLETVPGAGHWVHAEQPAALLSLLQNFFA
jgi:pimeloyl-ACP methyl ester carboxylesterase